MKIKNAFSNMILFMGIFMLINSCSDDDNIPITIFSSDDDIALGLQFDQEIRNSPGEYPLLDSVQYASAYAHLYDVRNTILAKGNLTYASKFQWKCRIIRNDTVINAFCVPGGNIYVYTGLIRFLDNDAEFAGVMAHEMAHADRRHTSEQLTLVYGETLLISLILGNNPSQLAEILAGLAQGLGNLAYSRSHEYEADEYAVRYLYPSQYDAAAIGSFFTKMENEPSPPTFLSSHPSPEDRLDKINETFQSLGGQHGQLFPEIYQQFINSLP
jgi:Zn-dependent protease with chaperone function